MTRNWWVYASMEILRQQQMGKTILFFKEAEMHSEYQWIAMCPNCKEILEVVDDNPADQQPVIEARARWEEKGYRVDRKSYAYVRAWRSDRGCRCEKVGK